MGGTGLWLLPWPALKPASAPRRPRAPESAPRSCIRRKAVRVRCHRCHGTGIGIASAPCPHPSGLPRAGGKGPHARVSACSTPSREPAAWAAGHEGSGAVLASLGTRWEQLYLAAPARNTRLQTARKVCILQPGAVSFLFAFPPSLCWFPISESPETIDMTGEGSPGTREVSRFDHQDAQ